MRSAVLLLFSAVALAHTSCDSICTTADGFRVLSGQKIYGSYANASVKNTSACQAMCCADLNCTAATVVDEGTYSLCFLHNKTAPAPVPTANNTVLTKTPCVTVDSDYGPAACTWKSHRSCSLCGALKSAKGTQNIALAHPTTVLNSGMCPLPKNATLNIYGDGTADASIGASSAPYGPLMEIPASTSVRFSRVFFEGTNFQQGNSVLINDGELRVEDSVFNKWGHYVTQVTASAPISVILNKGVLRVRDSNFTSTTSVAQSESGGAGGGNSASAVAYVIVNSGEADISGDCVFSGVSAQASGTGGGKFGSTSSAVAGAVVNSGVLRADGVSSFAGVTARSGGKKEAFGLKNQNGTVVLHNAVFTGVNASLASGAVTVCVGCSADPSSKVTGGGAFATCATTPPAYACNANTTCTDEPNGFGFSCN
eukprot:Hpha_TRINITY_DN27197_c0_g1::TRINITY_DN27197_c0_g1_i1::g.29358::m.29358